MTLYEEINALGGVVDPSDERSIGRMENLDEVLAILDWHGLRDPMGVHKVETDTALAELDWHDVRPELRRFASLMERQLDAHKWKGEWKRTQSVQTLITILIGNLHDLVDESRKPNANARRIGRKAVNQANYAMMIADVVGALGEKK